MWCGRQLPGTSPTLHWLQRRRGLRSFAPLLYLLLAPGKCSRPQCTQSIRSPEICGSPKRMFFNEICACPKLDVWSVSEALVHPTRILGAPAVFLVHGRAGVGSRFAPHSGIGPDSIASFIFYFPKDSFSECRPFPTDYALFQGSTRFGLAKSHTEIENTSMTIENISPQRIRSS